MKQNKLIGHLSAVAAYVIFGLNIVFCKDIATASVISPEALMGIRMIVAAIIFWGMSLFIKREVVHLKEVGSMAMAAVIGLVIPQYTFLKGITMATAIDTSILGSLTPIWTMIFAAMFLKEPITVKKTIGVITSLVGAMLLIFSSLHFASGNGSTTPFGIVLLLLNCMTFAAYLGIFRPLIQRYNVITLMKWMFLAASVVSLPFSVKPILCVDYSSITPTVAREIAYLVVFATIVAYFLIPIGQKNIRPTVVSMYTYLQPVIAVIVSVITGMDRLSWQKIVAIILVFSGVWIVTRSRAASH